MKTLIGLWLSNAVILLSAWWGGYFMIYEKGFEWMSDPVEALIITHSIIKFALTLAIVIRYVCKPENKYLKDALN